MSDWLYLTLFILIAMLATASTRAMPFLFLGRYKEHPLLVYLGEYLPPVVMVLLVVYATADLPLAGGQGWVSGLSLVIVAFTQWFSRNALLSIALGSAFYIFLI